MSINIERFWSKKYVLEIISKPFMFLLTPIKAWFTTQYKVSNNWVHRMASTACSPYLHKNDCVPHAKEIILMSPDSPIFPYIKKH